MQLQETEQALEQRRGELRAAKEAKGPQFCLVWFPFFPFFWAGGAWGGDGGGDGGVE